MPAEAIPFVLAITGAFAIFSATLAVVAHRTQRGARAASPEQGKGSKRGPQPAERGDR